MISLKQLKYALAVEQHHHFKRAAEHCAISQSALSSAISDMESQLGFQVFERDNKKVLVTPLGREMLAKAQQIYLQVSDLTSLADQADTPLSGPLSVGIIPTIAPYLLPLMLPAVQQQYPRLKLTIEEDQSAALVNKVLNGQLDTAIIALPYDCQGLLSFPFWQENFFLVVHSLNDLANQPQVKGDDIAANQLLLLKDGHCLKDQALSACKLKKTHTVNIRGTSLNTLVELVAGNLGATLVPEMALAQLTHEKPMLRSIKIDEPGPHREIAFVVRPNYPGLENIERLKASVLDQLSATQK